MIDASLNIRLDSQYNRLKVVEYGSIVKPDFMASLRLKMQ